MSDAARKLKFLRERDQVTLNRLAATVGLEKDYLRDVEAGRQEMSAQAIWLLAEFFKVKPDYFKTSDHGSARAAEPRGAGGSGSTRSGKNMDFGEFTYFKEAPAASEEPDEGTPGEDSYVGEGSQVIMHDASSDLADSAPGSAPAAPAAKPGTGRVKKRIEVAPATAPAPAPKTAPPAALRPIAPAPPTPSKTATAPKPPARSTAAPTGKQPLAPVAGHRPDPAVPMGRTPIAVDRPIIASDSVSMLKALVEILVKKGFFTREEFDEALHRHAGE